MDLRVGFGAAELRSGGRAAVSRRRSPLLCLVTALFAPLATAQVIPNVRINTDGTSNLHNEEQLAARPTDPNTVVAAWRDFRLGYRRIGVGTSHDQGQTWNDRLLPAIRYDWASDPGICADNAGNFYLHVLGIDPNSGVAGKAIQVFKSTDGGDTWNAPVDAVTSVPGLLDKQMIACDRSGGTTNGYVHLAWYDVSLGIRTNRSTNGGTTGSSPRRVSDGGSVQWPVPAVGPTGQVYVAWLEFGTGLKFDRSLDAGVTWGVDRTLTTTLIDSEALNGGVNVLSYPAMMVDVSNGPRRGTIYVAYLDRSAPGADTDIFLRRSTDQGTTWSAPVRVNDDPPGNGRDQFHPWLVVDGTGALAILWLDRRDDPQNLAWHAYVARSFDGGLSFTPNVRISTAPSSPIAGQTIAAGMIGEYIGLDLLGGDLYTVWTDTRAGQQDAWAAVAVDLDSDRDSAIDTADNCPTLANRLQRDGDNDGLGNECDPDVDGDTLANAVDGDDDGDGVLDLQDCAPLDRLVFARPGTANQLAITGSTWSWSSDPSGAATSYRLDRGTLGVYGLSSYDHHCLANGQFTALFVDPAAPPIGNGYYYLGLWENCFGAGPAGAASSGARPEGSCP